MVYNYMFPDSSVGKESASNAGDLGSTLGLGRSLGEGKGYPLQYSGLENSMDYIAHGVTKSRTQLATSTFPKLQSSRQMFSIMMTPQMKLQNSSQAPRAVGYRTGLQALF